MSGRGGYQGGGRGGGGRGGFNNSRGGGGRGGGGGFRGGRGGGNRGYDSGPPEEVIEVGHFTHFCENDIVCNTTCGKIPYFNAPVFFENKEQIGKIDEIFGGPKDNGFSVKLSEGIKSASFKPDQKIFIDPAKLLPIMRFLSDAPSGGRGRGARGGRGGGRGDRGGGRGRGGGDRGGRGGNRGFSGGDRGRGGAGRGGANRGGSGFRGGRGGGGEKRSFGSSGGSANNGPSAKKIKF